MSHYMVQDNFCALALNHILLQYGSFFKYAHSNCSEQENHPKDLLLEFCLRFKYEFIMLIRFVLLSWVKTDSLLIVQFKSHSALASANLKSFASVAGSRSDDDSLFLFLNSSLLCLTL